MYLPEELVVFHKKFSLSHKQHLGIDGYKNNETIQKIPFIVNGPVGHDHLNLCFEMTPMMLLLEQLEYKTQLKNKIIQFAKGLHVNLFQFEQNH